MCLRPQDWPIRESRGNEGLCVYYLLTLEIYEWIDTHVTLIRK